MAPLELLITNRLIEAISLTILHSIWQISLIVLFSSLLLLILRRHSSNLRYFITLVSFGLIILWSGVSFVDHYSHADSKETVLSTDNHPEMVVLESTFGQKHLIPSINQLFEKSISGILNLSTNANVIVIFWLIGVIFLASKLSGGLLLVAIRTRKGKIIADRKLLNMVKRLKCVMHINQKVQVFYSNHITVPSVVGVLKPVILVPVGMLAGIPANQVEAIVAHELAHIKRLDVLVNIVQSLIEIVFFFHPGIWWLSKIMRVERENCCDDLALKLCDEPITYIKALSNIEEFRLTKSNIMVALSNNKEHLLARIKRMITGKTQTMTSPVYLLAIALFVIGAISLKPVVYASPETGTISESYYENEGMYTSRISEVSEHNSGFYSSEPVILFPDTLKKNKKAVKNEYELERAIEEKENMEQDEDFDFDEELIISNEEIMKDLQRAFEDIHENLKDIEFDFNFDSFVDEFEDFDFDVDMDEFEFPDSIEMERIRKGWKDSTEELKRFMDEDFKIEMDQARKEMKSAMERMRKDLEEFKKNDWEEIKEDIKKSIEEWKNSEEFKKLDSLNFGYPELDAFYENSFDLQQNVIAKMEDRIRHHENRNIELQNRQKIRQDQNLQRMREMQSSRDASAVRKSKL